jgi:uncharacterized protein (TIGR02588 family)
LYKSTRRGNRIEADPFLLEFEARNAGGETCAELEIEGVLRAPSGRKERARASLDYLPGATRPGTPRGASACEGRCGAARRCVSSLDEP